jgi:hypothetical protein
MNLLVIIAITAGAGVLVAALLSKRLDKQPVPIRVRVNRRQD